MSNLLHNDDNYEDDINDDAKSIAIPCVLSENSRPKN